MIRTQRGFTLIELLVVIAIIGILSSVVLASLNSARSKGRDARRISDMKQLQLALELYYDANSQKYPVSTGTFATDLGTGFLTPNYISSLPVDPVNSSPNIYAYHALKSDGTTCGTGETCSSYVLRAVVEGTVPNGDINGTFGTGGTFDCENAGKNYCVRP